MDVRTGQDILNEENLVKMGNDYRLKSTVSGGLKLVRRYGLDNYQSICRRLREPTIYLIGVPTRRKPFWGPLTLFAFYKDVVDFLLLENVTQQDYDSMYLFSCGYMPSRYDWIWEPEPGCNTRPRQYSRRLPRGTILADEVTLQFQMAKPEFYWRETIGLFLHTDDLGLSRP